MKLLSTTAVAVLLLLACASDEDRKLEQHARRSYIAAVREALADTERCRESIKTATVQQGSSACDTAEADAEALGVRLAEYRAACLRCATAARCEAETRLLTKLRTMDFDALARQSACSPNAAQRLGMR